MNKKKIRSWYTVVGFYRDNNQVWAEHARAYCPRDAAYNALKIICGKCGSGEPAVVDVFPGQLQSALGKIVISWKIFNQYVIYNITNRNFFVNNKN